MSSLSLDNQLSNYNQQVGEIEEKWQARSREVTLCRKIEDTIAKGLEVLEKLDRDNEKWIEAVRTETEKFYWYKAGEIAHRFKYWLVLTSLVLGAIEYCESLGYVVDGAPGFRAHFVRVSGMSLDVDSARRARESKQTLTHAEAMRVVRARLQSPGA